MAKIKITQTGSPIPRAAVAHGRPGFGNEAAGRRSTGSTTLLRAGSSTTCLGQPLQRLSIIASTAILGLTFCSMASRQAMT